MLFLACPVPTQTFTADRKSPLLQEAPWLPQAGVVINEMCQSAFELFAYMCLLAACKQLKSETDLLVHSPTIQHDACPLARVADTEGMTC